MVLGQSSRMETAQSYLQQGRIEEARKILLELIKENPNHQGIHATLGQIAFSRQEFQQAVEHFRKADTVIARNPLMRVNLAEALFETGDDAGAAKAVLALLQDPDRAAAHADRTRTRALDLFTVGRTASAWFDLYDRCLTEETV